MNTRTLCLSLLALTTSAIAAPGSNPFFALPRVVSPGAPVQLHWNLADDPSIRCTPLGGEGTAWPQFYNLPAQDWEWLNVPATEGRLVFSLRCQGQNGAIIRSTEVVIRSQTSDAVLSATQSPWQQPVLGQSGAQAVGKPSMGGDEIVLLAEGEVAGISADGVGTHTLRYSTTDHTITAAGVAAEGPLTSPAVAATTWVLRGGLNAVATADGVLHTSRPPCAVASLFLPECVAPFSPEGLVGATDVANLSTAVQRRLAFRAISNWHHYTFDSSASALTSETLLASQNVFLMTQVDSPFNRPDLPELTLLSKRADGTAYDGPSSDPTMVRRPRLNFDLSGIVFVTAGSNMLTPTGPSNSARDSQICGLRYDDSEPDFESRYCVSRRRADGAFGNGASRSPTAVEIADDVIVVVYESDADNLVLDDRNGTTDVFASALTADGFIKGPVRLSIGASGAESNGPSRTPSLATDGQTIVFESAASNLVDGDSNQAGDIFLFDLASGQMQRVSTAADGGDANAPSTAPEINDDGRIAFRSTATNLVEPPITVGEAIYYRQSQRHGGSSRPSLVGLQMQPTSGSSCGGGFHTITAGRGTPRAEPGFDLGTYVETQGMPAYSSGLVAGLSNGTLGADITEAPTAATMQLLVARRGDADIASDVRVYGTTEGQTLAERSLLYEASVMIAPMQPMSVQITVPAGTIRVSVEIDGADFHTALLGGLQFATPMFLASEGQSSRYSKDASFIGLCLTEPALLDASVYSYDYPFRDPLANVRVRVYDQNGALRHAAPVR